MRQSLATAALLLMLGAGTAQGACFDNGFMETRAASVGPAAARVGFVADRSPARGCPNDSTACRLKAFVVPGDVVLTGKAEGAYVCAAFANSKGVLTTGYLPGAALAHLPGPAPALQDWVGNWFQIEATIAVKPAATPGQLAVHGDATYGADDPDRVRRGAVNLGELEGVMTPDSSGLLAFSMGDTATLPYDATDDTVCSVRMLRRGPYLVVEDNGKCGGMNVSFSGVYRRK